VNGAIFDKYIFPVPGKWKSESLDELKYILFGEHFRENEPSSPPDILQVAIAGFGPFRPAQFADPHSPGFQQVLDVENNVANFSVTPPFYLREGTVWSTFTEPPKMSLSDRRKMEKMIVDGNVDVHSFIASKTPTVPANVTLLLDGTNIPESYSRRLQEPENRSKATPAQLK
jgi:hypothetical protein